MENLIAIVIGTLGGFLLGLAFSYYICFRKLYNDRIVTSLSLIYIFLGLSGVSYGLFVPFTNLVDIPYRLFYIFLATAGLGGLLFTRIIAPSTFTTLVFAVFIVAGAVLFAFAFTPAFMSSNTYDVQPEDLEIRWAFVGMCALAILAPLISSVSIMWLTLRQYGRVISSLALELSVGFLLLSIITPVMAYLGLTEARLATLLLFMIWSFLGVIGLWTLNKKIIAIKRRLQEDVDTNAAIALRDPLTGVYNRSYALEILQQANERLKRISEPFAVCMVDLDNFKHVNDTYGHQVGDQVLIRAADVLTRGCRPYDTVARYGGEEFVAILKNINEHEALRVAERLRKGIEAMSVMAGDKQIKVTATFGVATVDKAYQNIADIITRADEAMYEGKRQGKNRVIRR